MTFLRVPLAVSAWSAVLTRTNFRLNSCWTRALRLSTLSIALSLSLFCHTYQKLHRYSLATRTTSSWNHGLLRVSFEDDVQVGKWRDYLQVTSSYLSQITTPITLIAITRNWEIVFLAHSYELCSLSSQSSELIIKLLVSNFKLPLTTNSSTILLILWILYLSRLCNEFL